MKDPTTIQLLITSLTGLATIVLTIMLPFILKRMEAKQAAKLEEYRKEVNGHMSQLIDSKVEAAGAKATIAEKEKSEAKADVVKAEVKAEVKVTPADTKVDNVTIQANTAEVKAEKIIKK